MPVTTIGGRPVIESGAASLCFGDQNCAITFSGVTLTVSFSNVAAVTSGVTSPTQMFIDLPRKGDMGNVAWEGSATVGGVGYKIAIAYSGVDNSGQFAHSLTWSISRS